jgi:hypothetical protein
MKLSTFNVSTNKKRPPPDYTFFTTSAALTISIFNVIPCVVMNVTVAGRFFAELMLQKAIKDRAVAARCPDGACA